jgi:hypothetical protein
MFKIGYATTWSPEVHHWAPPEDTEAKDRALDSLRDELQRAEASELAVLAELDEANAKLREFAWQTIETAPHDRVILLYRPGAIGVREVAPGRWDENEYATRSKPYWRCLSGTTSVRCDRDFWPTHWMDLPAPPTEDQP